MIEREEHVEEMLEPLLDTIRSSPELTSVLYDADMMPEQCRTHLGAMHLTLVVTLWDAWQRALLQLEEAKKR